MNIVCIVQARMGSSRLSGKVLLGIEGKSMLERVVQRVSKSELINQVWIATTRNAADDPIEQLAHELGLSVYRGSEHDVLSRYVGCAKAAEADLVVRITSDCPLVDPGVIDRVIRALRLGEYDFASNAIKRTFPKGLDCEVAWTDTLLRCARYAESAPAKEHVFWYLYREAPQRWLIKSVEDDADRSEYEWCVDTHGDLIRIRELYRLGAGQMGYRELIEKLDALGHAA